MTGSSHPPIGARVVHTNHPDRIRGVVQSIHIYAHRTKVEVVVDGYDGRSFEYDLKNLTIETK